MELPSAELVSQQGRFYSFTGEVARAKHSPNSSCPMQQLAYLLELAYKLAGA
jgi:hypothetical protein